MIRAPARPASLIPTPTVVTVLHTVALSPMRGTLVVLPKSVLLCFINQSDLTKNATVG